MPGIAEIGTQAAETALTVAPWLQDVPVLGRILIFLSPGGGNETKALEELQKLEQKKKTDRETRIQRNARYVLKASEAMLCVEEAAYDGQLLLAVAKGLWNTIASHRGASNAPDILTDRIFTCIESKVLKQTNRKHKKTSAYFARPARGHGKGRVTGTTLPPPPQPQGQPPRA